LYGVRGLIDAVPSLIGLVLRPRSVTFIISKNHLRLSQQYLKELFSPKITFFIFNTLKTRLLGQKITFLKFSREKSAGRQTFDRISSMFLGRRQTDELPKKLEFSNASISVVLRARKFEIGLK
jgi:hypothetical protein